MPFYHFSFVNKAAGSRGSILLGSLSYGLGFLIVSFARSTLILQLAFLICGFGMGLITVAGLVVVSVYFTNKRAIATGISLTGTSFSITLMSNLNEYLKLNYPTSTCFQVLAGVQLISL